MTGPRLLVRVDANAAIGAGHAIRCLALAQAWVDRGGSAVVATRSLTTSVRAAYQAEGIGVMDLASDDPGALQGLVAERRPDWLAVDGYRLGRHRPAPGSATRVLVIDDDGSSAPAPADVLVDQSLGATPEPYAGTPFGRLLLGSRYALLRRWFRTHAQPEGRVEPGPVQVLLSLAGSSRPELSGLLLDVAAQLRDADHTVTVVGADFGEHGSWLPDLPARLASFDLAISAAGSIVWELSWAGVPMLLLPIAENQRPAASALTEAGAAEAHDPAEPGLGDHLIARALALLADGAARQAMARAGQAIVDGAGATRVVDALAGVTGSRSPWATSG